MSSKHTGTEPSKIDGLARTFSRLGWMGFWAQVVLGSIPVVMTLFLFVFSPTPGGGPRASLSLVGYLSAVAFFILLFTIFWFFRYTRIGKRLKDPAARPAAASLLRTVWIGLIASTAGILFSIVVMVFEIAHMLFYFLAAPQAGVPTVQTTTGEFASWVSSVDMMSLLSLILTVGAEVWALILGLVLLSRTTNAAPELGEG